MQDRSLSRRTVLVSATAVAAGAAGVSAVTAAPAAAHQRDHRLKKIIARMSVEAKIGQLFVPYFYGASATSPSQVDQDRNLKELGVRTVAELIAKYQVGGVIYFSGWTNNLHDPHQIADLSNGVQRASLALPVPVPSLISIDQEHGVNVRIGSGATQLPGAMALGAGRSLSDARTAGWISGTELAALGIHQNFAPVADVNVNPANPIINVRSFGADAREVGRMVGAQVTGYQQAGVVACAKHFPGHGDTGEDSHTGLPVITHTREEWERIDAPPFRAAIAAGVDSIMTAHLQVPALDPSNEPATLSPTILQDVLRGELGFDGVIVTDALNMQGVRTKYGDDRVPVLALKAGADQLLFPPSIDVAYNGVLAAVRTGEITEDRLDASVLRILRVKEKAGLLSGTPFVSRRDVDRVVGSRRHRLTAARIAERTTTLLVNEDGALPLRRGRGKLLVVGASPAFPTDDTRTTVPELAKAFDELGYRTTHLATGRTPDAAKIDEAVAAARGRDAVVVTTDNVGATSTQRTLVSRLLATGVPVVHLAVRNPYDIAHLGDVPASLASYCWTEVELRAAARVIAGRVGPRGRLPVPVQRADDPSRVLFRTGHGLSYDD
ncbi:glycoside hydrolase family 3 protein [Streptomyces parvulus]|uniref:beta-N-acetylhexosaminidase n=1 Tax=Streptomyces parvulus TaxID=146923 RepID=A0A191V5L1_9ACTN|nr:glycoside hydrolase family 3 protein [Streptomyces parvulus]ANJ10215.1 beta-N-acetylhexosaminidase [Streptomyces parvulus]MCQ4194515.1 glycoside hydrolase family 3 protein [Streptomyces parvulus]GGR76587.1 beta-N-acetylhexosaminidase [Streptomyces parvulus]